MGKPRSGEGSVEGGEEGSVRAARSRPLVGRARTRTRTRTQRHRRRLAPGRVLVRGGVRGLVFSGDDGAKVAREGVSPTRRVRREETFKFFFPNLTLISRGDARLSARRAERRRGFGRTPRGRHRDGRRAVRGRRPTPSRLVAAPREEKTFVPAASFRGILRLGFAPARGGFARGTGDTPKRPNLPPRRRCARPSGAARGLATRRVSPRRESRFSDETVASLTRSSPTPTPRWTRSNNRGGGGADVLEELVRAREAQLASRTPGGGAVRGTRERGAPCRGFAEAARRDARAKALEEENENMKQTCEEMRVRLVAVAEAANGGGGYAIDREGRGCGG